MDTQPDRLKDAYRRIEVFWDGDQRYYRGTILGFQAAKGVHIVQYDDGQRHKEDLQVSLYATAIRVTAGQTWCDGLLVTSLCLVLLSGRSASVASR